MEETKVSGGVHMMDIGFNIIEKEAFATELFREKMSIIEFLRAVSREERFGRNVAVFGLDSLLYYSDDAEKVSKYIKTLLEDKANFLFRFNYIIQIVIDGKIEVVESQERPRIKYKDVEFLLYPIFGRVKQVDLKHFIAPLNLQS